jgi:inactive STAND
MSKDNLFEVKMKNNINNEISHRKELRKLLELLDEKILFLKRKKITEGNTYVLFQLNKEIEAAEAERQSIARQIESLNSSTSSQTLYLALLKLGYKEQILTFRRFLRSQSIGAFLIHGSPDYGQIWLLHCLLTQHIDDKKNGKVLHIELHRIGRKIDISTLWRELGGRCGLARNNTPTEIIDRIYQCWQTQNVILIFNEVDCMPDDYLQQLIQEFWIPLAKQARETSLSTQKHKLLMFLVDYEGCVGTRGTLFAERIQPNWEVNIPVKLPAINPFSEHELNEWLEMVEMEFDELPIVEIMRQKENLVQEILENSDNGIPELVFFEICDLCNVNWYEAKDRWIKFHPSRTIDITRQVEYESSLLSLQEDLKVPPSATNVLYSLSLNTSQNSLPIGGELAIDFTVNLQENNNNNIYLLEIPQNEAIANDLNIILTAPGFLFNNDNTTSLPLDPDTADIIQTATFNLTALRPGKTKIQAELYVGETYKTTLETEVEVTAFESTQLPPLIAARSRPVPQPNLILQVRTHWNADISACSFNYHIDIYQPRLLFADGVDCSSQSLSGIWVERTRQLLKTTLEEAATSQPEDFRSRLSSLGQYLFQSLFPEELQSTFRAIASLNRPFTLLIIADQDAWLPWELFHDGQKFLGDRLIIGRWLWESEKARPYEFPVGAVNVAHYASVEQPELWTQLLHSSGAPPPVSMQAGIFNDVSLLESIRGLHLIRYGQSVEAANRQDAPMRVNSSSDIEDIEREVQPAKLSLRRNHPLVSLSYVNAGQVELTELEETWASTFVRAGCSAFVGSLWAVQAPVEAAFVSAFYRSIWAGQTLGVAFNTAHRLAKTVVPESLDWLAYVLFGDPMARPYRPVRGQGYAVVEPIGQEIDDPVAPGSTVRFRVSLRRTPPVWYENRLMEVAEDLTFEDLRVFIVTSGLQVTPGDSVIMTPTATRDYLGWFMLTVPPEMENRSVLVQVYFEDGMEPVHHLRFSLQVSNGDGV